MHIERLSDTRLMIVEDDGSDYEFCGAKERVDQEVKRLLTTEAGRLVSNQAVSEEPLQMPVMNFCREPTLQHTNPLPFHSQVGAEPAVQRKQANYLGAAGAMSFNNDTLTLPTMNYAGDMGPQLPPSWYRDDQQNRATQTYQRNSQAPVTEEPMLMPVMNFASDEQHLEDDAGGEEPLHAPTMNYAE
jgi:hypothetical protein